MDLRVVEALAEPVGTRWRRIQKEKAAVGAKFFVAMPLSSTPLPIFRWIIENASTFPGWELVRFVLMDEQVEGLMPPFRYVDVDDAASYEGFAHRHLLDPLADVTGTMIPVIKPDLDSIDTFKSKLDLLVLAIGMNGNFANVMPGTSMGIGWHVTHLHPDFRTAHTAAGSQSYAGASFREYGMSLGPQQVRHASEVIVIASGVKKRGLVERLVNLTTVDEAFPISIVHDVTAAQKTTVVVTPDTLPNSK